jgi:hypothetical protein
MNSLLSKIKEKISSLDLLKKIGMIIFLPLIVVSILLKITKAIQGSIRESRIKETDERDRQMMEEISKIQNEISRKEGKLEALQEAKKEAMESSKDEDPVSFHNSRKKK